MRFYKLGGALLLGLFWGLFLNAVILRFFDVIYWKGFWAGSFFSILIIFTVIWAIDANKETS